MTEAGKVDLGQPQDPGSPYTHLLSLVEDLVRRGNRVARHGARGGVFSSNQGGYLAILAEPLDIAHLRSTYDLTGLDHDEAHDLLFDTRDWVSIYGSGGRLA